jgi:predicted nuclease of predicted toxin-antitoxin system
VTELRFYFDESVELAVSQQLQYAGIDVVSAHSLELLGDSDENHLQRATMLGRVLCTYDQDFLRLASDGMSHSGIIFAHQQRASIGGWVREIKAIHAQMQVSELENQVIYLAMSG